MMVIVATVISVTVLLTCVQFLLSFNSLMSEPQLTVLESGFESLKSSVLLSSSFFMMVALFVLFDLELILLFPAILVHIAINLNWVMMWMLIIVVVIMTLFLEWVWFGLKWQV